MSARFGTLTILFIGLPLLAAVLNPAAGQETAANAADQPRARTWTDRRGKHQTEASLVEVTVTLKTKDGTTINVPLESLSDADRVYVRRSLSRDENSSAPVGKARPIAAPRQPTTPPKRGHNVADIVPGGGKGPAHAALPAGRELVVTGVGTDPDKAVQNAFSQVIEQTVGVLVDAETVVKNDELIRDEILTYSRGYVEKYEIVKRWQEAGLHHATIRAVVARDKLVEKLRGMKIAVTEISGDLPSRQFEFDAKNEEQAGKMFRKAMAGFDMVKLTQVEIVGQPEITREGANAKVRVKIKLYPDMEVWQQFSQSVRPILTKAASRRASVTFGGRRHSDLRALKRQLEGDGILVALLVRFSNDMQQAQWEVFRVPDSMNAAVGATASSVHCRLTCALQDAQHNDLARVTVMRSGDYYEGLGVVLRREDEYPLGDISFLSPGWRRGGGHGTVFETTALFETSLDDLGKLAHAVAFLEADSSGGQRSRPAPKHALPASE